MKLQVTKRSDEQGNIDFLNDKLSDERRLKLLTIMDELTRECIVIEMGTGISGERVVRTLSRLGEMRGLQQTLVTDNGPEFTRKAMLVWSQIAGVGQHFIDPEYWFRKASTERLCGEI